MKGYEHQADNSSCHLNDHMAFPCNSPTQGKAMSDEVGHASPNIYPPQYLHCLHLTTQPPSHSSKISNSSSYAVSESQVIFGKKTLISPKKLIKLAKKWQKVAAKGRKMIFFPRTDREVADEGYFVVYSSDQRRFMIPLAYINSRIVQALLEMSEEEFGLPSDGPIAMPCDSVFMDYILSLVRRGLSESIERALLNSIATDWCSLSASSCQEWRSLDLFISAY